MAVDIGDCDTDRRGPKALHMNDIERASKILGSMKVFEARVDIIRTNPRLCLFTVNGSIWEDGLQDKMREAAEAYWKQRVALCREHLADMGVDVS